MDDATRQILFGAVCPVVVTGGLLGAAYAATRRPENRARWSWLGAVAVGVPTLLAFLALYGWPGSKETWRTAAFAPMLGLVAGLVTAVLPSRLVRVLAIVALAAGLTVLIRPYTKPEHWALQLLPMPVLIVLVGGMGALASRRRGPTMAIAAAVCVAAGAGLVLISGFLKLSIPVGALAISMTVLALYSLVRRDLSLERVMLVVLPTTFVALFIAYLEVKFRKDPIPPAAFATVALAPLSMWLGEIPWLHRRPAVAAIVRVAVAVAVTGVGVLLAVTAAKPEETDPYAELYKDLGK